MKKNIFGHSLFIPSVLFFLPSFAITFALISQYVFGMLPCILCVYQRVPFVIIIALGCVSFLFKKQKKLLKILLLIAAILYLGNSTLAVFHVGVEKGYWKGTEKCDGSLAVDSLEALHDKLMNTPAVKCTETQFVFLSLSMAAWNVLFCLFMSIFCLFIYKKQKS